MRKSERRIEQIKNAIGGISAIALFGSSYLNVLDQAKSYAFLIYEKVLETLSTLTGLPPTIIHIVIVLTGLYISVKLMEGTIRTLVIISWILFIILVIANLMLNNLIGSWLPQGGT